MLKKLKSDKSQTKATKKVKIKQTGIEEHEIQKKAYEIYCASGHTPGNDLNNWLQAKRELKIEC